MGMMGSGLEKFDPATNTFTHFRHDPKNASSLICDTVGQSSKTIWEIFGSAPFVDWICLTGRQVNLSITGMT
jgi:hypothetical protein